MFYNFNSLSFCNNLCIFLCVPCPPTGRFARFLCALCGFGCFLPQRTRSRRKEHKDLYV